MTPLDLFSKRQKKLRGQIPDVFVYDQVPHALRVQIVHIWRDTIGSTSIFQTPADNVYKKIVKSLCREYGVFTLAPGNSPEEILANFLLNESDVERVLDCVEVSFLVTEYFRNRVPNYVGRARTTLTVDEAIEELNARFREHAVGYEYVRYEIIRKDSEFLHSEAVKPTLALLQDSRYKGANDEFMKAHEHYRHGEIND